MLRYELDDYVQEHVADDAVNVNCVASWRAYGDAEGPVAILRDDLHNGWHFDSQQWKGRADASLRIMQALRRIERGQHEQSRATA